MSNKVATTISELAAQVDASEISTDFEDSVIQEILDGIEHDGIDTNDHDYIHGMIDGLVDIYNASLYEWASDTSNHTHIEEAMSEWGGDLDDYTKLLQLGQYKMYEAAFAEVFEWLESELEQRFEDGIYVRALYLDPDDYTKETMEGVPAEVLEDFIGMGEVDMDEGGGVFLITNMQPDDLEYLIDTHEDDDGNLFSVTVGED